MSYDDYSLLTYKETASKLKVSIRTVTRMADSGKLERVYPTPRCPRITLLSVLKITTNNKKLPSVQALSTPIESRFSTPSEAELSINKLLG